MGITTNVVNPERGQKRQRNYGMGAFNYGKNYGVMTMINGPVPCNGCRACCQGGYPVALGPFDDLNSFDFTVQPIGPNLISKVKDDAESIPLEIFEEPGCKVSADTIARWRAQGITHASLVLRREPNGDCIYLGEHGCTIYERRPQGCRRFDCRVMFASLTRVERRQRIKDFFPFKNIFDAARHRLSP